MFDSGKEISLGKYKNIIGSAKETIDAIQRFIEKNAPQQTVSNNVEEAPAESINRVLNSVANDETNMDIQKIINNL